MNNNADNDQKNPCKDLFWRNRGYPEKPRNWRQLLDAMGYMDQESDQSSSESESSEYDSDSDDSDYEEQCQQIKTNNTNNNLYPQAKQWRQNPNNFKGNMEWGPT